MTLLQRIRKVGIIPMLYKLKHLYVKQSPEIITLCSQEGAYDYLQRYEHVCNYPHQNTEYPPIASSNYIWVCWLQGEKQAPLLVQQCIKSIREHCKDKEVVVLTDENIKDYVDIPQHIYTKLQNKEMTRTHFSDILRLHLLNQYGGVWIDSTILLTGELPGFIKESSFFVFQSAKESGHVCCATGFMASCPHHPIVADALAILMAYWENENKLISYSVIHLVITMAIKTCDSNKSLWEKMPLYYYADCEKLRIKLNNEFDEKTWREIKQLTPIHKLTYKFDEYNIDPKKEGSFYDVLINNHTIC